MATAMATAAAIPPATATATAMAAAMVGGLVGNFPPIFFFFPHNSQNQTAKKNRKTGLKR
jgi:hypothetical protein